MTPPRQTMPSASCISTRAVSSNGSLPHERLRPGPENLFRRKLRASLMIVSILIAFMIFGVLAGFYRAAGETRRRGPADHRQQDQLHPADADRLFHSRARGGRGAAGDLRQLVRRLLSGPEELHHGARDRAEDLFRRLPQRIRGCARSSFRPSCATAAARWSAKAWRRNGAGRSATASRCEQHLQPEERRRTWDLTIAGIVKGKAEHVDTNFLCSSTPISTRPARSARTPSAG